jgi:hypothetical protein
MTETEFPERDWPSFNLVESMGSLSIDEMEEFEDATGLIFTAMRGSIPARGIKGLMWIAFKRVFPDLAIEEVGKLTVDDLGGVETNDGDEEDPI